MIALPRHLSPWAAQLALFPEDIALVLGRMAVQLADLVGSWRLDQGGAETPNGYDGVIPRGDYERLLTSEWLLLDELPEEFLRRAVSGEHMFLRRACQGSAAARRCMALFDCGAGQLGAPRIAQLAILIVLGQRAEKLGARFEWGVLQAPVATLRDSVGAAQVHDLLRSRYARAVSPEDVERWTAALAPAPASELWLVGAEELGPLARQRGVSSLLVSDVLELGAPQRVRVVAAPPGGAREKEAVLAVPEGGAAARLLRDPMMTAAGNRQKSSVRISAGSNIVFSYDGRQLWVRGDHGTLMCFHIPNSTNAKARATTVFTPPKGKTVVAVAPRRWGKSTVVALLNNERLEICSLTKKGGAVRQILFSTDSNDQMRPTFSPGAPLRPLAILNHKHFCFIDADGDCVEIRDGGWSLSQTPRALASKATWDGFALAWRTGRVWGVSKFALDATGKVTHTPLGPDTPPLPDDTRYYFGTGDPPCIAAYSPSNSSCSVALGRDIRKVEIPRDRSAIGIISELPQGTMCPVVLDATRTRIEILGKEGLETILTTTTVIACAAVSDAARHIAYITESGELGVYARGVGVVLRAAPPEAAQ